MTILVGMARSPSTRRRVIGVTALVLATVFRTSVASPDVVQLRDVDGDPEYYSRFSNSLPGGVWFEFVVDSYADLDKDAGLNLYVGLTADSSLALVQRIGMRAILQQSEWRTNLTASYAMACISV